MINTSARINQSNGDINYLIIEYLKSAQFIDNNKKEQIINNLKENLSFGNVIDVNLTCHKSNYDLRGEIIRHVNDTSLNEIINHYLASRPIESDKYFITDYDQEKRNQNNSNKQNAISFNRNNFSRKLKKSSDFLNFHHKNFNLNYSKSTRDSLEYRTILNYSHMKTILGHVQMDANLSIEPVPIFCMCFSEDSEFIYTGDDVGTIKIWSTLTGEIIETFRLFSSNENKLAITDLLAFNNCLIACSEDKNLVIWNTKTLQICGSFTFDEGLLNVNGYKYVYQGETRHLLIVGAQSGKMYFIDMDINETTDEEYKNIFPLKFHIDKTIQDFYNLGKMKSLELSGMSSDDYNGLLVSGFHDGLVCIWDTTRILDSAIQKREFLHNFSQYAFYAQLCHRTTVQLVEFSPDKSHFLTGSLDGTVLVWKIFPELVASIRRDYYLKKEINLFSRIPVSNITTISESEDRIKCSVNVATWTKKNNYIIAMISSKARKKSRLDNEIDIEEDINSKKRSSSLIVYSLKLNKIIHKYNEHSGIKGLNFIDENYIFGCHPLYEEIIFTLNGTRSIILFNIKTGEIIKKFKQNDFFFDSDKKTPLACEGMFSKKGDYFGITTYSGSLSIFSIYSKNSYSATYMNQFYSSEFDTNLQHYNNKISTTGIPSLNSLFPKPVNMYNLPYIIEQPYSFFKLEQIRNNKKILNNKYCLSDNEIRHRFLSNNLITYEKNFSERVLECQKEEEAYYNAEKDNMNYRIIRNNNNNEEIDQIAEDNLSEDENYDENEESIRENVNPRNNRNNEILYDDDMDIEEEEYNDLELSRDDLRVTSALRNQNNTNNNSNNNLWSQRLRRPIPNNNRQRSNNINIQPRITSTRYNLRNNVRNNNSSHSNSRNRNNMTNENNSNGTPVRNYHLRNRIEIAANNGELNLNNNNSNSNNNNNNENENQINLNTPSFNSKKKNHVIMDDEEEEEIGTEKEKNKEKEKTENDNEDEDIIIINKQKKDNSEERKKEEEKEKEKKKEENEEENQKEKIKEKINENLGIKEKNKIKNKDKDKDKEKIKEKTKDKEKTKEKIKKKKENEEYDEYDDDEEYKDSPVKKKKQQLKKRGRGRPRKIKTNKLLEDEDEKSAESEYEESYHDSESEENKEAMKGLEAEELEDEEEERELSEDPDYIGINTDDENDENYTINSKKNKKNKNNSDDSSEMKNYQYKKDPNFLKYKHHKLLMEKITKDNKNHICFFCRQTYLGNEQESVKLFGPFYLNENNGKVLTSQLNIHLELKEIYVDLLCLAENNDFSQMNKRDCIFNPTNSIEEVIRQNKTCFRCGSSMATKKCHGCQKMFHGTLCLTQMTEEYDGHKFCLECLKKKYANYLKEKTKPNKRINYDKVNKNYFLSTKIFNSQYFPQIEEDVYFILHAYIQFLSDKYQYILFEADEKQRIFWWNDSVYTDKNPHFNFFEPFLCKVKKIEFGFPNQQTLVLIKERSVVNKFHSNLKIIIKLQLQIIELDNLEINIIIFENDNPDFLVRKSIYEETLKYYQDNIVTKKVKNIQVNLSEDIIDVILEDNKPEETTANFATSKFNSLKVVTESDKDDVQKYSFWDLCINNNHNNTITKKMKFIMNGLYDTIKSVCEKNEETKIFYDIVSEDRAPNYYEEVPVPMYIKLISNRLINHYYITEESIKFDIQLLVDNAAKYNGANSEIANDAEILKKRLINEIAKLSDKYEDKDDNKDDNNNNVINYNSDKENTFKFGGKKRKRAMNNLGLNEEIFNFEIDDPSEDYLYGNHKKRELRSSNRMNNINNIVGNKNSYNNISINISINNTKNVPSIKKKLKKKKKV